MWDASRYQRPCEDRKLSECEQLLGKGTKGQGQNGQKRGAISQPAISFEFDNNLEEELRINPTFFLSEKET